MDNVFNWLFEAADKLVRQKFKIELQASISGKKKVYVKNRF